MATIISINYFSKAGRKNKSKEVYMLETVRVSFHISLTEVQLGNSGYLLEIDSKEQDIETLNTYLLVSNGALTKVTYYQLNYQYPVPILQYELSLPKILFENNVSLISKEEETSATETQRQARSCNYRPGTLTGNTRDKDNYRE